VATDARCLPLVDLGVDEPVLRGAEIWGVARIGGGLVNTIYRVVPAGGAALALRIYAGGAEAFDTERRILIRAPATMP
jgi:hypothetical protein